MTRASVRNPHFEIEDRLRLETLIADLSARFIEVPPDGVDREIPAALRGLGEALGIERCALVQWSERSRDPAIVHAHPASGLPSAAPELPWIRERMLAGQAVVIPKVDALPSVARTEKDLFRRLGMESGIAIPLSAGGAVGGAVGFVALSGEREWPESQVGRLRLLARVFAGALARKRARESLDERLRFEKLLADLSARFVNLPSERIDEVIEDSLTAQIECLGHDRSTITEFTGEKGEALVTHSLAVPGTKPFPVNTNADGQFPWYIDQIRGGTTRLYKNLPDDLPPEAAKEREYCIAEGVRSNLAIPLKMGGSVLGVLTFDFFRRPCDWPPDFIARLKLVGEVFANALARKRADRALQESEERMALAAESANLGIWVLDIPGDSFWISDRARTLLGMGDEAPVNFGRLMDFIHPDDRGPVAEKVRRTIEERGNFRLEHRVLLGDGQVRWLDVLGSCRLDPAGRPHRLTGICIDITQSKEFQRSLQSALVEVERLKERLQEENVDLRDRVSHLHGDARIVGGSLAIRRTLSRVEQVAPTNSTVLLLGETGTGKELLANAIHDRSPRRGGTMVCLNCAAIPSALIESELFGREKGAYTGALSRQIGRFEMADGSTLFLDEIGDLPPEVQAKLLRVLQERKVERLGSPRPVNVDVRIIAATNQDLEKAVRDGRFRQDLYYRLAVFPIVIPPLRERPEDIEPLVWAFVDELSRRMGKPIDSISRPDLEALKRYRWPGNVRELRNAVERAMILCTGSKLRLEPPGAGAPPAESSLALDDVQREHIRKVLAMTGRRIRGKGGAAELLRMKPSTLESRMARLGIRRPRG